MRATEQSGDDAKRLHASDAVTRRSWARRTVISLLEKLLARVRERDVATEYATLIETLPFGVACWGPDARLIASNSRFAERVRVEALQTGAAYHEVVKALAQGGYMQSVREDWENRLLELHREDGSTLLIEERPLADSGFVTLVMDVTESRHKDCMIAPRKATGKPKMPQSESAN